MGLHRREVGEPDPGAHLRAGILTTSFPSPAMPTAFSSEWFLPCLRLFVVGVFAAVAFVPGLSGPANAAESDELFLRGLERFPGMEISLFADQAQVANPVAFAIDARSRIHLVETMRFRIGGVDDLRDHDYFFDDDMQIRTLGDRVAMYEKWAAAKRPLEFFSQQSERIAVLEDTDGDGKADRRTIFADGFNDPLDGTAAGLLIDGPDAYFTCIPHLWKLTDADGDLRADSREPLASGFGLRLSLSGHDLHGVVFGPDGKLYFSLGDRGFRVPLREGGELFEPYEGGLFRCNPDGSALELVYHGLRNPQELAFDDHGNLFTVDNNGDMGDRARITYLIEGGHTGWQAGWQVHQTFRRQAGFRGSKMNPWMDEAMWELASDRQPAYLTPALGHITAGPSGFALDPGPASGLPARLAGRFLVCDYTGGANSGIHAFALEPEGAGFRLAAEDRLVWGVAVTDVDFGFDGRIYCTDYIEGWHKDFREKGRVFALSSPTETDADAVRALAALSASHIESLPEPQLAALLGHADRRIRMRAQFALAKRGPSAIGLLASTVADRSLGTVHRLHALWGLGQLAAADRTALESVAPILEDEVPPLRAQAAKVLGDHRWHDAQPTLIRLLHDPDAHVKALAAIALGRLGNPSAREEAIELVARTEGRDPWLRHAAGMALSGTAGPDGLAALVAHDNDWVRLAAVVGLRRFRDARLGDFVGDPAPNVAEEAIRAVYDLRMEACLPAVADRLDDVVDAGDGREAAAIGFSPLTLHRVIRANHRLGEPVRAGKLALAGADRRLPPQVRLEALECLEEWGTPHPVDRVIAQWWPASARETPPVSQVLAGALTGIVAGEDEPGELRASALRAAAVHAVPLDPELQFALLADEETPSELRLALLSQLTADKPDRTGPLLGPLLADDSLDVRIAAARAIPRLLPAAEGFTLLSRTIDDAGSPTSLRQAALRALGAVDDAAAVAFLGDAFDRLERGEFPTELQLDLITACDSELSAPALRTRATAFRASLASRPLVEQFAYALQGGDARAGEAVFNQHPTAQCSRCHKVENKGGIAGPDLSGIGARKDGSYILQSLVDPGAAVAPGFGLVSVTLNDGSIVAGILADESPDGLVVTLPDGTARDIPADTIAAKTPPVSSMPPMGFLLSADELRDVVAYLTELRNVAAESGNH